MSPPTNNWE